MFNRDRLLLLLLLLWCLALLVGCGQASVETWETERTLSVMPRPEFGATSIEERILTSDVVARVRLVSAGGTVLPYPGPPKKYMGVLVFRFQVLEYLKGSGSSEVVAIARELDSLDSTPAEADAAVPYLVAARDTRWDDREAIVFLESNEPGQRSQYLIGRYSVLEEDDYSLASRFSRNWLPEAATDTSVGTRSTDTAEKRFLLAAPSSAGEDSAPTITVRTLKKRIADVDREIAAGDGSEEYRACILEKHAVRRKLSWEIATKGSVLSWKHDYALGSGVPSGSVVYEDLVGGLAPDRTGRYWLEGGEDKDLFTVEVVGTPFPFTYASPNDAIMSTLRISTIRPLPTGDYTFHSEGIWGGRLVCSRQPLGLEKGRYSRHVHVTAPVDVLHEAFFDPVAIGDAVGAAGNNGVLKPAAFRVGGVSTTMQSLKWENGTVTMKLKPSASLAGNAIDFIALDGSVALTLSFDDAGSARTLTGQTWSVADQPWQAGDLLMLRIGPAAK